jgi:hypothetical protein
VEHTNKGVCLRGPVLADHRPADRPCQLALGAVVGCGALARAGFFRGARAVVRAVEAVLVARGGGRLALQAAAVDVFAESAMKRSNSP